MYRYGEGVEKDLVIADRHYSENRHHADSLYERGLIYINRSALEENVKELVEGAEKRTLICFQDALEKYKREAKCGDTNAMYMLSRMFFCGHGVERNLEKAKEYCQCAVDKYDTQAMKFMNVINFGQKNEIAISHIVEVLIEE